MKRLATTLKTFIFTTNYHTVGTFNCLHNKEKWQDCQLCVKIPTQIPTKLAQFNMSPKFKLGY